MLVFLLISTAFAQTEPPIQPRYAEYNLLHPLRSDLEGKELERALKGVLEARGITTLTVTGPDGERAQYRPKKARTHTLREMNPEAASALRFVLINESPGIELDALVIPISPQEHGEEVPRRPVTVAWDHPAELSVHTGTIVDAVTAPTVTLEAFMARWGVELEIEDQDWSITELGQLDEALALLTPAEQVIVTGIPFRRVSSPPLEGATAAFLFDPEDGARMEFFQMQEDRQRSVFFGTPDAPRLIALSPLVHEFGHAVANAQLIASLQPITPLIRSLNNAVKQHARLTEQGASPAELRVVSGRYQEAVADLATAGWSLEALERACQQLALPNEAERTLEHMIGDRPRVSQYADSNTAELFAETFMLARLDPDAARRLYPDVMDWLDASGHLPAQ